MSGISQKLSTFCLGAVPEGEAVDVLRLSLLDWMAVGIAGKDEPVARLLRSQALEEGGAEQAGMIGSATKVPARMAAMVNGTTSHALDYDDTHFAHIGHPSVAVFPAALAVAEWQGAGGREFQQAALTGAEASIRVGQWLGRAHYQAGFHQTATAGAFGATIAAARLMKFEQKKVEMALGLVSTRASGLKSQFGTMGKPLNAGIAASNGVEAAMLVQKGFVSASGAMEMEQGFGPTHHGKDQVVALDDLGKVWMFKDVSHKFHACCHGLHATLEAVKKLDRVPADKIENIEVHTHPRWLSVCNIPTPATGLEAKFSYAMVIAMDLLGYDTSRLENFSDALCSDPAIASLRERVRVQGDPELSEMQSRVRVHLMDGSETERSHDLEKVCELEERQARVRNKSAALLGEDRAEVLWQMILGNAAPDDLAAQLTK